MTDFRPLKKFGQNFLTQPAIAKKIVDSLDISAEDAIIEIGPGPGALSRFISAKNPAHYTAIEIDARWAEHIRELFPGKIDILSEDFLKFDLERIYAAHASVKVIGNIPYNITSPILFKLLDAHRHIKASVIMMQKEVARRIVGEPNSKAYGILSVLMQTFATPQLLFDVGRQNFKPAPKVDSSIIRFDYIKQIPGLNDPVLFRKIVRGAFNQRRKMLRNSLSRIFDRSIVYSLSSVAIDRRPDSLSRDEFIMLANELGTFLK